MTIVLASASPRRRELLRSVGIECVIEPANIDESIVHGELPRDYVTRVARSKADVTPTQGRCAIAADTIVELDGRVLGKPQDVDEALEMMRSLVGRQHTVTTAFVVAQDSGLVERQVTTDVTMRAAEDVEIREYVDAGEWQGKAGGYAVQGMAAALVTSIRGSYTNVVGLPLAEVIAVLIGLGIAVPHYNRGTPA